LRQVSVIITVYDGERYLEETLRSVFSQDYGEFEVIAVLDGGHDGSGAILDRVEDGRLMVVRQENAGAGAATAAGLALATGKYVAFLDQDDLWEPGKLRAHVKRMEEAPDLDLTFSWFTVIDAHGREMGIHSSRVRGCVGFRDLVTDFVIGGTSNVVARREALLEAGGVDPEVRGMYDLDLFARVALLRAGNVEAIPRELIRYRRHAGQMTRDIAGIEREWIKVLGKLRALAPEDVAAVERLASANMCRYFARLCYEARRYEDGLRYLRRGYGEAPHAFWGDRRNWLTLGACTAGWLLPLPLLGALERLAGVRRSGPGSASS
jgi:glycosyltransferase involved in cell wall biosynthesis